MTAADTEAAFDLLHPAVQHHVVNSLGWRTLRPLQAATIEPILAGEHVIATAPTAGGKTEAAVLPVLSRMLAEDWRGLSVLYVCPLRALLNNLHERLDRYATLVGRSVGLWHGDIGQPERRRLLAEPPDVLLTTPESLESMLVSQAVNHNRWFANVRCVVVDEIHAFAGDDRGWHLLAVLERVARIAGRPLQRIGLSATLGNPDELLSWLTAMRGRRAGDPANRRSRLGPAGDPRLRGKPRECGRGHLPTPPGRETPGLRRQPSPGRATGARSAPARGDHLRLPRLPRRRAAAGRRGGVRAGPGLCHRRYLHPRAGHRRRGLGPGHPDRRPPDGRCLPSTSRPDRPPGRQQPQRAPPRHQRRRPLRAASVLLRWGEGYVEPVSPPLLPLHIAAQQLLALSLQEAGVGRSTWTEWLGQPFVLGSAAAEHLPAIVDHLTGQGFLADDSGVLGVGPTAEDAFGQQYFMELLSVFTSPPMFSVRHGRHEIGVVPDEALTARPAGLAAGGAHVLVLAGRSWAVIHVDWPRRVVQVEPADAPGVARWTGSGQPLGAVLARGIREVLTGRNPDVEISQRAAD